MTWDTNWAASKAVGKIPRNALNQIRNCLNERANTSTFAITIPAALGINTLPTESWFDEFQLAMTVLFTRFADHTQAVGGSYNGQASVPQWTEANITALCDVTARLPAPDYKTIPTNWIWQQYQMLNLLRWARMVGGNVSAWNREYRVGTDSASFANAATAYNAAAWVSTNPINDIGFDDRQWCALAYWSNSGPTPYRVRRNRVQPQMDTNNTLTKDVDFYYGIGNPGGAGGGITYGSFFNANGESVTVNTMYEDTPAALTGTAVQTIQAGTPFTGNNTTPGYTNAVAHAVNPVNEGWKIGQSPTFTAVVKYDVTNGFTFKDW